MASKITMQDIADKIGVSKVTVSKALSDKDGVSDELKAKIKALSEELGYRYNASASAMKLGLSKNIGVIIPERFTGDYKSFYLTIFQYLSVALDQYQYSSILHVLSDEHEKALSLPGTYFERKADAYIILGQISTTYVDLLVGSDVPILFFDFYEEHTELDSINTDNFYGSYGMTNYLIQNGHTKLAFVGSISATSSIQDRYLGYYKSLIEHGIPLNTDYVIEDRNKKGKYIPVRLPEEMPTAFVCNNDQVAYNLIEALQAGGYRVPEDISVVGYDNDIYASVSKPKITTVDVNMEDMTTTAARIIVDKIKYPEKKYGRILIKGSIKYGESVKKLN